MMIFQTIKDHQNIILADKIPLQYLTVILQNITDPKNLIIPVEKFIGMLNSNLLKYKLECLTVIYRNINDN